MIGEILEYYRNMLLIMFIQFFINILFVGIYSADECFIIAPVDPQGNS